MPPMRRVRWSLAIASLALAGFLLFVWIASYRGSGYILFQSEGTNRIEFGTARGLTAQGVAFAGAHGAFGKAIYIKDGDVKPGVVMFVPTGFALFPRADSSVSLMPILAVLLALPMAWVVAGRKRKTKPGICAVADTTCELPRIGVPSAELCQRQALHGRIRACPMFSTSMGTRLRGSRVRDGSCRG
jgi:hypothetical protein